MYIRVDCGSDVRTAYGRVPGILDMQIERQPFRCLNNEQYDSRYLVTRAQLQCHIKTGVTSRLVSP